MRKSFTYTPKNNSNQSWYISYHCSKDKCYRNYVLLNQKDTDIKLTVPLIMLNPGSFDSSDTFGRDTTLRIIRKAFLNSHCRVEILNLFNVCQVNMKRLADMSENERNKENPILERLNRYKEGNKVIIQWGKLDKYRFAVERSKAILQYIIEKELVPIGLQAEKGYYYHPRRWYFVNGIARFKEEIISKLEP